jgi:hypothetical protein
VSGKQKNLLTAHCSLITDMRDVSTIAQAFFSAADAVSTIAEAKFFTEFSLEDLERIARTPLLLISPHMMYPAYPRHRQRGTQLLVNTFLISRQQRLERNSSAALALMDVLGALDTAIVGNNLSLSIQPFENYQRKTVEVKKGISVVRTIYATIIYSELSTSKFTYVNGVGATVSIEFPLISTSFQTEEVTDNNDYDWTLNGTYKSYNRTAKKKYNLRFTLISSTLKGNLLTMKQANKPITFYRAKTGSATMTCLWSNDFNFFEETPGFWTGSITLHEV